MAKEKGIRSRWAQLVLYPESQQEVIDHITQNWSCAWALHDKDRQPDGSAKKPHVHILCHFKNARYFTGIAAECGVPVNYVERVDSPRAALEYLTHDNETDPLKAHYPHECVGFHDFDPSECGEEAKGLNEEEQVKLLFEMPQQLTLRQTARWAYENGCWSAYRRSYSIWKDIKAEDKLYADKQKVSALGSTGTGQVVMR